MMVENCIFSASRLFIPFPPEPQQEAQKISIMKIKRIIIVVSFEGNSIPSDIYLIQECLEKSLFRSSSLSLRKCPYGSRREDDGDAEAGWLAGWQQQENRFAHFNIYSHICAFFLSMAKDNSWLHKIIWRTYRRNMEKMIIFFYSPSPTLSFLIAKIYILGYI
jgi:hypothetical protein